MLLKNWKDFFHVFAIKSNPVNPVNPVKKGKQ